MKSKKEKVSIGLFERIADDDPTNGAMLPAYLAW